jgi:heme oxygenase
LRPESQPQRKTPLLIADLDVLGARAPAQLPLCTELPELFSAAQVLGCLYVLEGATLGGQVISRHLRTTLGIGPETGGRLFHGYGEQTAAHFRAFSASLVAFGREHGQKDSMVQSAIATFRAMRNFCHGAAA